MKKDNNYDEMKAVIADLESDDKVQEMKEYVQHGKVSTYDHCRNVAKLSYDIDRMLHLKCDLKVLLTGAMLHDFYLYDWHNDDGGTHRLHGFTHAKTAAEKAKKRFDIDKKTGDVISSHMWPLNPEKIPKSKEAWVVCIADKCASLYETVFRR
ncbi:MAG: HD domain-containing protein [Blautia sp.]|nr:HD domain-containing protein [Blautia sp.]